MDEGLARAAEVGLVDLASLSASPAYQRLRADVEAANGDLEVTEALMGTALGMILAVERLGLELTQASAREAVLLAKLEALSGDPPVKCPCSACLPPGPGAV